MSGHITRGRLLLEQSRFEQAEQELRLGLSQVPDDAFGHAFLALALLGQDDVKPAAESVQNAIGLLPDHPYPHYVASLVACQRERHDAALNHISEALQLDPDDADLHAHKAVIMFELKQWSAAQKSAEQALRIDPEHPEATNVRAHALINLGEHSVANDTIEAALAKDPENAMTHATMGWAMLQSGNHTEALQHFQESLRLDPESEGARAGVVEALKARNPLYGLMLKYFLWMNKLSGKAQWGFIIGLYLVFRILRGIAQSNPELSVYITPLIYVYIAFVVLTWTSRPMFNLLLRFNRYGRLALADDSVKESNLVAACAVVSSALLIAGIYWNSSLLTAALCAALLIMPVSAIYPCDAGWPRQTMAAYTLGLLALACMHTYLALIGTPEALNTSTVLLGLFLLGIFINGFVANALVDARVRR